MQRSVRSTATVLWLVGALTASTVAMAPANAAPPSAAPVGAATAAVTKSPDEIKVDRIRTPVPKWFTCEPFAPRAECASVPLPLDYDAPFGAKTTVAVLRIPARKPATRIGTLFLNPGGPGGSGVQIAAAAGAFLSPALLDRFDIVGFDPRGTNFSDSVKCFSDLGQQYDALEPILTLPFPVSRPEVRSYAQASDSFGKACSTTGKPLSGSMSTAEVARDMDLLRRMTGDTKLTYLGFSYGSYLGTAYANMFPNRVRSVAIDGVLDPNAWAGTKATANTPQTQRIKSGEGAAKALQEILVRCGRKGPDYCQLASQGDPRKTYAAIVADLKAAPIVLEGPDGEPFLTISYPVLTSVLLSSLYSPYAGMDVDFILSDILTLLEEEAAPGTTAGKKQAAARTAMVKRVKAQADTANSQAREQRRLGRAVGWAFPYDNSPEAFQSVLCTDGLNPARARDWDTYAKAGDRLAPDFGRLWTWASAPCASSTWTVRDEDAVKGPFNRTTSPVLVVGNYWDPATNYQGAVAAAKVMPGSRLLSSDSWGHTAYGTSSCVTTAVDKYLLSRTLPAVGKKCVGDIQPFSEGVESTERRARDARPLPPVVPPIPGAVPRR